MECLVSVCEFGEVGEVDGSVGVEVGRAAGVGQPVFADFLIIPQPKNIRTVEFGEIIPLNSISWS